jgi:PAS domain S-box-containing protein
MTDRSQKPNESYLSTLFEEMPLGVFLVDADFQIKAVNSAARRVFGDIPDLTGRDFSEIFHILWDQTHADRIVELFQRTIETGESYFSPERFERRTDFSIDYYEWQLNRILISEGNYGVACYFRDVTASVSEIQNITAVSEQYYALINSIDEGYCVVEILFDENEKPVDYRFLEINRAFEEQTGIENGVGQRMREIVPHHEEHWFEIYGSVALTGETIRFENSADQLNRWYDVYAFRVGEPQSRQVGILFKDITESKLAEIALKNFNQQMENQTGIFSSTLSSITDYVYHLDKDAKFIYANQALLDLWGIKELSPSGISMRELDYPKEVENLVTESVKKVFEIKKTVKDQTAYLSPTGANEYHEFIFNPIFDDDGNVKYIIGSSRNIKEHKQMEDALRAADRRKDEFLATLSHELRTPLNSILGWSQILKNHNLDEVEKNRAIDTIERNARSQNQLIEDILDVSRIITGKFRLDVRAVDLVKVISTAIEIVRPAAEAKNIRIQTLLDPKAAAISGDPDRLQQIVWNLLSNAVKFTPKGGRVQVRLERVNSHVEIIISDTGRGIDPEYLPHVFDRFSQFDGSMTRRQGGLGLGLAIVRQIVELHGGMVSVSSEGENQGATFMINLPLLPIRKEPEGEFPRVHPAAQNETAQSPDKSPELTGLSILVVEDERDSRDLVEMVLSSGGAEVKTTASAKEAIESLLNEKFDLLISDIGMPEEDGFSLIAKVRKLPAEQNGNIPAIALTAYARSEDRIKALRSGFQMHISKPVEHSELIAVAANLGGKIGKSA